MVKQAKTETFDQGNQDNQGTIGENTDLNKFKNMQGSIIKEQFKKIITKIKQKQQRTPPENVVNTQEIQSEELRELDPEKIKNLRYGLNKKTVSEFFNNVIKIKNITEEQKLLLLLAQKGLTTENGKTNNFVRNLQTQLFFKGPAINGKFGKNTFNKLKQKFGMYTPRQENIGNGEKQSTKPKESIDGVFNFNADNYKYYVEYHNAHDQDICATYAYGIASDILASKGYCFPTTAVSSWNIKGQRDIQDKFSINTLSDTNSKQQITNAPAGTFLTLKYDRTSYQDKGVSHVMVSLGNGVYTDIFGSKIRKIDFKSDVTFSGKKISFDGSNYTLTEDSRLMSPKLGNFIKGSKETINKQNVTPEEFANEVRESTGADIHYIKSLIAKENNLSLSDFNTKKSNLSVKIIKKEISDLNIDNVEGSNDIAKNFLNGIKEKKSDIMSYYHNLTNYEYDEIARRAMGILYQESDSGSTNSRGGLKYRGKEALHGVADHYQIVGNTRAVYGSLRGKSFSRGYTQIKFNENFSASDKAFLKTLGVKNESDLTNGKKCGIATMVALINKYNQYIKPMKRDPFWTNDAIITTIKFNDNTSEEIAKKKAVPIDGQHRVRTQAEIDNLISKRASKHGGIKEQINTKRPGIKKDQTFFDYLYYSRNRPSEIVYGTASLSDNSGNNQYIAQCNEYMDNYTQMA